MKTFVRSGLILTGLFGIACSFVHSSEPGRSLKSGQLFVPQKLGPVRLNQGSVLISHKLYILADLSRPEAHLTLLDYAPVVEQFLSE